jgi:hypothetical protein
VHCIFGTYLYGVKIGAPVIKISFDRVTWEARLVERTLRAPGIPSSSTMLGSDKTEPWTGTLAEPVSHTLLSDGGPNTRVTIYHRFHPDFTDLSQIPM